MPNATGRKYLPIHIQSLEAEGFSYFPRQEVPLHAKINGLIGLNGAGKTTFLNMIRVLIGSRKYDNNQTLNTFFEREDVHEIYIVARFSNAVHLQHGRRPFQAIGKKQDVVSVVCRIKRETLKREYLIFDGHFDLEEDLKGHIRWYSVEQYARQMQEVGLTRALINACSLSQGNTEELMEKSEEELADYILQICGEQERIERFRQIKADIKQLKDTYAQIDRLKQDDERALRDLERNLELCKRIVRLQEDIDKDLFELPLSEYALIEKEIQELTSLLLELEQTIQELTIKENLLKVELSGFEVQKEEVNKVFVQLSEELQALFNEKSNTTIQLNDVVQTVADLAHFVRTYEAVSVRDLAELKGQKRDLEHLYREVIADTRMLQKQKEELGEKIVRLEKSQRTEYPVPVRDMRKWLEEQQIEYLLMADCVEIKDESWREAVEAMLGNERFTIAVEPKHMVAVMKAAQNARYPFWISPFKTVNLSLRSESVLQKVTLTDVRVSGYLERFARYMMAGDMKEAWAWVEQGYSALLHKPSPYQVVERGGRSIKAKELCCGRLAYEAQLLECRRQLGELTPQVIEAEFLEQEQHNKLQEVYDAIETQQQVLLLPEKTAELTRVNNEKAGLERILGIAETAIGDWNNKVKVAESIRADIVDNVAHCKASVIQTITARDDKQGEHKDTASKKEGAERKALDVKGKLSPQQLELLYDGIMASLKKPEEYRLSMENKKNKLEEYREDLTAVLPGEEHVQVKLTQSLERQRLLLDQHLEEIQKIQTDLADLEIKREDAKREYRLMVDEVFQKVRKSLVAMALQGGFEADLRAAYFEDERWKIDYRIGFNGKLTKSYRDKSALSGGQKVIASLLLTFAAIKADGVMSFMLLDEPFAHLDEGRIALAGEFLSSSNAQIIIGMPYSENIKLFMPWVNNLLNFRPKQEGMDVAPPITIGEVHGL